MNIIDKEKREFVDWLGRKVFRLLRFVAAAVLIGLVCWSLAPEFKEHVNKHVADLIPTTKVRIESFAAPPQAGENLGSTELSTNSATANIEQIRTITKQQSESATPRVWAYGLQLAAWVAVLGAALWAIVALCRSDV